MADEWVTAGSTKPDTPAPAPAPVSELPDNDALRIPNPDTNALYKQVRTELATLHKELRVMEIEGKLSMKSDNPVEISDYLAKMRLRCNSLFTYYNKYIDVLTELQTDYATKRQRLYEEGLAAKKSPSAAQVNAREMTQIDENLVEQCKNRIQQIKNEYERYNGICIFLHARVKEFNTEKIMG